MAVKTQAQLLAEVASLLADNTTGNISALDVRTCLNDIIDSANYGGSKVYKALLNQSGTSAPTFVEKVDTLDTTPIFTRTTAGVYISTETYDETKTFVDIPNVYAGDILHLEAFVDGAELGGTNKIIINNRTNLGVLSDINGSYNIPFQIEVYP